ncbi:MAG: alpha-D-ribose 1-methylphosphonate 5-triphosphate diphosphatase [Pseudomonadota bacterium]
MSHALTLSGGHVLLPDAGLQKMDLSLADGLISENLTHGQVVDCSGYYILPGIVDVHGDAFEQELHPRPGVGIDFDIAMRSVDRQLLAHGITTAFHGLTLSWEPGARSLETGRVFMEGLAKLGPTLMADHRVQFRWETFAHDAIEDIAVWLKRDPKPSLAFNDHTTATLAMIGSVDQAKLTKWAQRTGCTPEVYMAMAEEAGARRGDVPAKIKEVAEMALAAGAIILSHDDRTIEDRQSFRALGATVCEFPLSRIAAEEAHDAGEPVIMGGPNVIRGGSHLGMLSAEEAIREGLCTILASDYYYPSQINAAERLVRKGVRSFESAWNIVSRNPAEAMGLADRGQIAPGKRADLVVLDTSGPWRLVHTIAGGEVVSFGR